MPKHKDEETALALTGAGGSIMETMPDYLRTTSGDEPIRGAENVESSDYVMPRLAIASKQSPQVDENSEKHIEGLKQGQFFNSITREIYGPEIYVVPLLEVKTRAVFRPYGEDGPPLCLSSDGRTGVGDPGGDCAACPMRQFTRTEKGDSIKPRCTEIMNYAVLLMPANGGKPADGVWKHAPRLDTVSVIGFKSTSIGSAKNWNTLLRLRNRDWFAGVYKLTAVAQSDGKNSWHIPLVENAGWQSEEGYRLALPCYESIKGMFASGRARVDEFSEREPGDEE